MPTFRNTTESEQQTILKKVTRITSGPGRPSAAQRKIKSNIGETQVLFQHHDPFTTCALQVGDEIFLGSAKRARYEPMQDDDDPERGETIALSRAVESVLGK